jgi:hypothetical protein
MDKNFLAVIIGGMILVGILICAAIYSDHLRGERELRRVEVACGPDAGRSESERSAQCIFALSGRGS